MPEAEAEPGSDREPAVSPTPQPVGVAGALREVLLLGGVLGAFCAGLFYWMSRNAGDAPAGGAALGTLFVGDAACASCHPGEAASHARSGHSRTLRPAAESPAGRGLVGREFRDAEYDATWRYDLRDGRLAAERVAGAEVSRFILDYAFGSGGHATTFVGLTDRTPTSPAALEHRLTVFAGREAPETTPGQTKDTRVDPGELTPHGRVLGAGKTLECFGCHSTLLNASGSNALDTDTLIPNIRCERCHGPGRDHVAAARAGRGNLGMPFGPGKSTADLQMRHCGFCHRHPDMAPPGEIQPENPGLARFQPVGLMQSACYKKTPGGLSCTACHDPHARASADRGRYQAACLGCHQSAPQAICPVSPKENCLSCHMPPRDAGQGVLFHDHWIRVPDGSQPKR